MTYLINCSPEDDVFQAFMAMGAHYEKVRAQVLGHSYNFIARIVRVPNQSMHLDPGLPKGVHVLVKVPAARLHLGCRRILAVHLTSRALFYMKEIQSRPMLPSQRGRMPHRNPVVVGEIERD